MIYKLKKIFRIILNRDNIGLQNFQDCNAVLLERFANHGLNNFLNFSFDLLKTNTLSYVNSMRFSPSSFEYLYSSSCTKPNIYSSAYACMILSIFNVLNELTEVEKLEWAKYFNNFQNKEDGLFYDKSIINFDYINADWWGARHLTIHLIGAFVALGQRPKYQFNYLKNYYNLTYLKAWLDEKDWLGKFPHSDDIDNKIMNIVLALQYQRDYWNDYKAGMAVKFVQEYLIEKINPDTGMWGYYNINDKNELSRMIQFSYHIFAMYFYDNIDICNKEKIIDYTLKTQNIYGGFGVMLNSSACEDIDSIDILIRLSNLTSYRRNDIVLALKKAFIWILVNQNEDGGYVFRRNEPMFYGNEQMYSGRNRSAMFPTWFRTLTIAHLSNFFGRSEFNIIRAPSY